MTDPAITIRSATIHDAQALSRLAALGGSRALRGRALLAERDGVAVAAIALNNGSVVSDPVRPGTDAVDMLKRRRYRLLRQGGDVGQARFLLRRLVPPLAA